MRIVVEAPNPEWPAAFEAEAKKLREALQPNLAAIHHIGSTAILGIVAKPTIDVLLVVPSFLLLDASAPALIGLGYEGMGEFGITERRYFRKDSAVGIRTHHLHAYEVGNPRIEQHLAFRDYMNEHPDVAQTYGALKARLAAVHSDDRQEYMNGKANFIKEVETTALMWIRRRPKQLA
jgi:GrpB-like predicted nucleotidyltransferase (UPF0157 family)